MRCLALAAAWEAVDGEAHFVTRALPEGVARQVRSRGFHLHEVDVSAGSWDDAELTMSTARRVGAEHLVADGYCFGWNYQRAIKQVGRTLLVDDNAENARYCADLVLNQNPFAHEGLYRDREEGCRLLLGLRYALLRPEFLRDEANGVVEKSHWLLTMGGTDPSGCTERVLRAIRDLDPMPVMEVVVGSASESLMALEEIVRVGGNRFRLQVDCEDMAVLMREAGGAISAGGSTCWELLRMGVPLIAMATVDNQRNVVDCLEQLGCGVSLGWHTDVTDSVIREGLERLLEDRAARASMRRRGQALVDGNGAQRVVAALADDKGGESLRRVEWADAYQLWLLRNQESVRRVSLSTAEISLAEHLAWFARQMESTSARHWVLESADAVVGQVRYQRTDDAVVVSTSVSEVGRRRGVARRLLMETLPTAVRELGGQRALAVISPANEASVRLFEGCGFRLAAESHAGDGRFHEYEWSLAS